MVREIKPRVILLVMFFLNRKVREEREEFFPLSGWRFVFIRTTSTSSLRSARWRTGKTKRLAERPFTVVQGKPAGRGIRHLSMVKRTKIPKTNCVFGDLSRIRLA